MRALGRTPLPPPTPPNLVPPAPLRAPRVGAAPSTAPPPPSGSGRFHIRLPPTTPLRILCDHACKRSDAVYRALLACPRDLFVPRRYRHEALTDMPIRVEEHGFNISVRARTHAC